jgi:hypothetical protein
VLPDPRVQEALRHVVFVEWRYDGKGGKVTQWTRKHGDPDPADPCILGWVLDAEEKELAGPGDGFFRDPDTLARRLVAVARARKGPGVPFLLAEAEAERLPEAEEALERGEAVLVYCFRPEDKACLAFEEKILSKGRIPTLARKVSCLKLDLGLDANLAYAKAQGVSAAPAVVLLPVNGEKSLLARSTLTAATLEAELDKLSKAP